jgi:hypothetical protein
VVYSELAGAKTESALVIYKCNKDTELNFMELKMFSEYIAVILAKVFILTVFVMGMISLVIEVIEGTI